MSDCPLMMVCTFFDEQMSDMPGMVKLVETQYCHKDFVNCARFVVSSALGMGSVPGNLLPGRLDKGKLISDLTSHISN